MSKIVKNIKNLGYNMCNQSISHRKRFRQIRTTKGNVVINIIFAVCEIFVQNRLLELRSHYIRYSVKCESDETAFYISTQ